MGLQYPRLFLFSPMTMRVVYKPPKVFSEVIVWLSGIQIDAWQCGDIALWRQLNLAFHIDAGQGIMIPTRSPISSSIPGTNRMCCVGSSCRSRMRKRICQCELLCILTLLPHLPLLYDLPLSFWPVFLSILPYHVMNCSAIYPSHFGPCF